MKQFANHTRHARRSFGALIALVLIAAVSSGLFAAAPAQINYQGKLTDSSGIPFTGTKNVTFSFWNNATVGAGSQIGSDVTVNNVSVVNGVFNAVIDVSGIAFVSNLDVYLQIRIDGSNFGPTRQKLVAAPYALAVAAGSVGVTELNTADVDARYPNLDVNETISANWVNTANPWADNEVSDTLTVGAGGSVAAAAIAAGTLGSDVIASSVDVNSVTDSAIVSLSASKILAGALGPSVRASSVAVNSVYDSAIVSMDAAKLTGTVTATAVGANSVGTTQIINSSVTLNDLDQADVDSRYVTIGTVQTLTGNKTVSGIWTLTGNWVNTANPWADSEVSDILTVAAGSTVTASAIDAGYLPSDVIASSVAVNAVTTSQIFDNTIALGDLNTGSVDGRYVTTATAQGITGLKTLNSGVKIGSSGTTIVNYSTYTVNCAVGNLPVSGSKVCPNATGFNVPGVAQGDLVLITPQDPAWPEAVMITGYVSAADRIKFNVFNSSGAPVNVGTLDFTVGVVQH